MDLTTVLSSLVCILVGAVTCYTLLWELRRRIKRDIELDYYEERGELDRKLESISSQRISLEVREIGLSQNEACVDRYFRLMNQLNLDDDMDKRYGIAIQVLKDVGKDA